MLYCAPNGLFSGTQTSMKTCETFPHVAAPGDEWSQRATRFTHQTHNAL